MIDQTYMYTSNSTLIFLVNTTYWQLFPLKGHKVSTYQQLRNYEEEEREGIKKKSEKIQCNSLYNQHIHVTMYSTLLIMIVN